MAEAFLKNFDKANRFHVESAGLTKGVLHLPTIFIMKEIAIDISNNKTKNINELIKKLNKFDYVIFLSEKNRIDKTPEGLLFKNRIHWLIKSPRNFLSSTDQNLQMRELRSTIEANVIKFMNEALSKNVPK